MIRREQVPFFSRRRAFTLVEIALSLGIAGFALVAILGVIPVAIETAKEARHETRATFIAQTIMETLRSGIEGNGTLQIDSNREVPVAFESIPLPPAIESVTHDLAYDIGGTFLGQIKEYDYAMGQETLPGTVFIARLILRRNGELVKTEVSVETPAIAAEPNRRKYSYVTLIRP